jgi:hypothetical protein
MVNARSRSKRSLRDQRAGSVGRETGYDRLVSNVSETYASTKTLRGPCKTIQHTIISVSLKETLNVVFGMRPESNVKLIHIYHPYISHFQV